MKQQKSIQKVIDGFQKDLFLPRESQEDGRRLREFIASLPPIKSADNSFDVRWSLSELENIVYDFINPNGLPAEFKVKCKDVEKSDLMKVQRLDKGIADSTPLPNLVRDYILHDRGNSLFLGDSFGNLPSPVHESATIKRLFKFADDEKEVKRITKDQNIKVEGKDKQKKDPVIVPNRDFKVDLRDINKFVFDETKSKPIE